MSPLGSPASYFAESGVEVFLAADFAVVFVPALLDEAAAAVFFLADEAVVFAVVVFLVEADLVVFVAVFVAVVFDAEDFAVDAFVAEVLVADFAVVFLAVEAFEAVVFAVAAERLGAGFLVGAALGSVIGASV